MRDTLTVRRALPGDAGDIVDLFRQSFRPEDLSLTIYGCRGIAEYLRRKFASDRPMDANPGSVNLGSANLVGVSGKKIAGFVELRTVAGGVSLNYIATHPACRGTGVARELLAAALRESAPPAGADFTLDVFEHNAAARAWYERSGFRTLGRTAFWRVPTADREATDGVRIEGMPEAQAAYDLYGFSSFRITTLEPARTLTIGWLGERWFRVTDSAFWQHPETWCALRAIDRHREILFQGAQAAIPPAIREICSPLLWNIQMGRRL